MANMQLYLTHLYRLQSSANTALPNRTGMPAGLMRQSALDSSDVTKQPMIPDHAVACVA